MTPPKVKERTHVPASDNIIGTLDQLLEDIKSWPSGPVNWSEKARLYKIRTTGQDSTLPNGGQMIKSFLQHRGVDISHLGQGKTKGTLSEHLL